MQNEELEHALSLMNRVKQILNNQQSRPSLSAWNKVNEKWQEVDRTIFHWGTWKKPMTGTAETEVDDDIRAKDFQLISFSVVAVEDSKEVKAFDAARSVCE